MNILVLKPGIRSIECSYPGTTPESPRTFSLDTAYLPEELSELRVTISDSRRFSKPDALAVRVNFGGMEFRDPVLVDDLALNKLRNLVPQAPLHLPVVLQLLESCHRFFADKPVVLLFETAFFTRLPRRESTYGIDQNLSESLGLRRRGYYGLFHEAACEYTTRERRARRTNATARILSICLEAHPEITAVIGRRPVMCTSGATPLEGIPGHSSCGELDPSIVLMLAKKMKWGPEQINAVLAQQSGLLGLVERPVMLDDVLEAKTADLELAQALIRNRILLACGAGMASMGGLDDIVFSGRFASAGLTLGPWLKNRLTFRGGNETHGPEWLCFTESLEQVMADKATVFLLESKTPASV